MCKIKYIFYTYKEPPSNEQKSTVWMYVRKGFKENNFAPLIWRLERILNIGVNSLFQSNLTANPIVMPNYHKNEMKINQI